MEELTIWEQHTITLNKDSKLGFGFAISGGKDKPHPDTGDTTVVVSDVLPNGPAMGRLFTKDQIVMVNGVSMENVHSNYTIQTLRSSGKTANITVKRPRKIQIPATTRPTRAASHSNLLDADPPRRTRRYSDGSDNRDDDRYRPRARSNTPDRNGHGNTLPLMSSGYKRLPYQDVPEKPIRTTLLKKKITDEYGLKLGSQIFIKHMTETGLAAKEGTLQEGDLILKINGMTTENLSLLETKHLVEKSRGKLTMTVLRDERKFLVSIPEVEDSAPNSGDDRRRDSSSELEGERKLMDVTKIKALKNSRFFFFSLSRTRAELPPAKSRDSSPVRSTLTRPPARTHASRRGHLSGMSTLPNPRSAPAAHNWPTSRPTSSASRPRKPVSESDSDRSVSPRPRRESPRPDTRYKVLPDLPHAGLRASPITVRPEPPRRVSSPFRVPPPDSESESDDGSSAPPQRHSTTYSQDSLTKTVEEPIYSLPPDSYPSPNPGYSSDLQTVSFVKEGSVGLRLVGGNDVGIFVGGVQPNSPAYEQGMKEGDQIMQVNKVDFGQFTREEAANFLLNIKKGEPVQICTQHKMDIYKKIIKSNLADNFYIRTHFDHEAEGPIGLSFSRGEVFRVVDTMHRGKLGHWLAVRMGNDLHEMDKGTIPNQASAETLASLEQAQRGTGERQVSGPRAEFWKLRGLRGNKKNEKYTRRSREDLLQLTIQGKFPAYERVLLREANFKRPIVIMGPLNDIAMEKLARELPDEYEVANMVPRSGAGESGSTVIKLDTVRRIAEKDRHPLLDITPTAVERLNYIQYHPMVLFLDPHSRKDVKAMRQRYSPNSNKSSRRLYSQALKLRKHCSHLFSARIDLHPGSNVWYESLKDKIRHQQSKPVWVSEVTLESGEEHDLDALDQTQSDYLSAASDLEDTDGEAFTDGEAYTDNEDLEEAYPGQNRADPPRGSRVVGAALARSSEPAPRHRSPDEDPEPYADNYSLREIPPLMHVPEPRIPRRESYSPPHSAAEAEDPTHRSFTDSDFSALDIIAPTTPSDGPPDFIAPDPSTRYSVNEPTLLFTSLDPSVLLFYSLAHHHQAVQFRRTQIRGSDSSDDDEDETEDIEWGPATEL
uniref:Tight junction protein 3 n=1 Tax=Sparus aurata TaxID=8175 RepID=A0A671U6H0_SPAAU